MPHEFLKKLDLNTTDIKSLTKAKGINTIADICKASKDKIGEIIDNPKTAASLK